METKEDVIRKASVLEAMIQEVKNIKCTEAQKLALIFGLRIASVSRNIVLLTDSGAAIEAHTICRLLLEHFFNFRALLQRESHLDVLLGHSSGEPTRQLKKILNKHEQSQTLNPENLQRVVEYLGHPDRKNDPKNGLNWEQIAGSADDDGLYTLYKIYSFCYAHSTLMSILKDVSEEDIAKLHKNVCAVLEQSRLLLRLKLLNPANQKES